MEYGGQLNGHLHRETIFLATTLTNILVSLRTHNWLKGGEQDTKSTHQRILFLPDTQYVNFTAAAHVEQDNEKCSNPT